MLKNHGKMHATITFVTFKSKLNFAQLSIDKQPDTIRIEQKLLLIYVQSEIVC